MKPEKIIKSCENILQTPITSVKYVGGGDINEARLLETPKGKYFIKFNAAPQSQTMFEKEAAGLKLLQSTATLRIPEVLGTDNTGDGAFLLLEYIEQGARTKNFWKNFGISLANLHKNSAEFFGLEYDNFIGSLKQNNNKHTNWTTFFINERLLPQLKPALSSNLLSTSDETKFQNIFKELPSICPKEPPALIHGDLWSGNFLAGNDEKAVLIDPAVSFAHREMDLAMTMLFGGFAGYFYESYNDVMPLSPGFSDRVEIYQLYYLLVHVNLFGSGYVNSVRQIIRRF